MATHPFTVAAGGDNADPLTEAWTPPPDLTLREVCDLPLPEGQEILGPLLMAGSRLVIGGRSGEGKTTFVMAMARAVSEGSRFLEWTGCGGTVLIFDLEQGLRTVQRRAREAHLHESDRVRYLRIPDGLQLEDNETQVAWLEDLFTRHQPAMVVLDPLYKAHQGDSNDERAMVDMMRQLDRMRDTHGFALVIPMHLRKLDPRSSTITMDDIFGSGGLTRGAEVVVGLRRLAPGKAQLYFWKDRDGDLAEYDKWELEFTRQDGFTRSPHGEETDPAILIKRAFLHNGSGAMSNAQLQVATGKSERTIRDTLIAMMDAGQVAETTHKGAHGRKFYRLELGAVDDLERWETLAADDGLQ